jgi:hypothetical protein
MSAGNAAATSTWKSNDESPVIAVERARGSAPVRLIDELNEFAEQAAPWVSCATCSSHHRSERMETQSSASVSLTIPTLSIRWINTSLCSIETDDTLESVG